MTRDLFTDVCQRKHGGAATSEAAFARVAPTIRESHADILAWLRARGMGTAKQYAEDRGIGLNKCSGRWSELKRAGKIILTGHRLGGAAVYRLA